MDFLTQGNVCAMVVEGEDTRNKMLELKKQIRAQYALGEKRENLIHSSDNIQSAEYEIGNFFDAYA